MEGLGNHCLAVRHAITPDQEKGLTYRNLRQGCDPNANEREQSLVHNAYLVFNNDHRHIWYFSE